jgi:branched-chain amino acid transport system substrate-binding protein
MISSRSVRLLAMGVVTAGLLAGCEKGIPSSIKIGVAQPLSGPSAARGQDLLNGVKLAVNELNATGFAIAGKPVKVEVVALDDKADAGIAKKVAQDLVDQNVIAVIGHLSSDVTEATIPIYKKGNVPQLFTSSAAELTKLGEGNAFRLVANDSLQAQAIASFLNDPLKASRVAIIYEDTAFGAPIHKDVAALLARQNKTVHISQSVDNKITDFSAFVAKLAAAPPDALVAVLRDHQLLPLFRQMHGAQLSHVPVIATSVAKTEKLASAPIDVKSLYLTSSALAPGEFRAGADFVRRFRAAYNADPVWAAHYAYDAVYAVADTLRLARAVDANVLRDQLHAVDASAPVTSSLRFTAEGDLRYGAIAVYQRRKGTWDPLMRSDKW